MDGKQDYIEIFDDAVIESNEEVIDSAESKQEGINAEEVKEKEFPIKQTFKMGKGKKIIIAVAVVLFIAVVAMVGFLSDKSNTYEWPSNSKIASLIPEPDGKITDLTVDDDSYLNATVKMKDADACKDYMEECVAAGFTKDKSYSIYEDDFDYQAKNKDGYEIWVYNYDNELNISVEVPIGLDDLDDEEDVADSKEDHKDSSSGSTSSSDFKSMLDSYEKFIDDYIAFMKKYEDSDDSSAMMSDYMDMLNKYSDFAEKIDAIDEDELSDSDYSYYLEVTTRVNKKILEAGI